METDCGFFAARARMCFGAPVPSPPANVRRDPLALAEPKRHEVAGLLVLSVGALLGFALASYDVAGGADWVGPLGARVAESLVAFLGSAAVLIPWSLVVVSVRLFRRTVRPVRPWRTVGTLGIILAVSTALHLVLGERPMLGGLAAGGLVGATMGELLRATLGNAGAHTVVLTALLVALVIRTRLSVVSLAAATREAGTRGGLFARNGVAVLAKAWREAREKPAKAPATPSPEGAPEVREGSRGAAKKPTRCIRPALPCRWSTASAPAWRRPRPLACRSPTAATPAAWPWSPAIPSMPTRHPIGRRWRAAG
jgi:hypothetical protein